MSKENRELRNLEEKRKMKRSVLFLGIMVFSIVLTTFILINIFQPKQETIIQGDVITREIVNLQGGSLYNASGSPIGYEIFNGTLHTWNTQDDYFFNISSGIQFTNHYNDYWTRNIFCLGYYDVNDTWNKIKCADELNNFNRNIITDNATYVNATLWKDVTFGGYDIRFGIQYHLKLNDENMSITITIKNIDAEDLPNELGFGWRMRDINISGYDRINVNMSHYDLDSVINKEFEDMIFSFDGNPPKEYSYFILREQGGPEFLRLDWDETLDYNVFLNSDGTQESATVDLLLNAGNFNAGVEKQTTMHWIDAIGDLLATNSTPDGEIGVTVNETFMWLGGAGTDDEIYRYWLNGSKINTYDISGNTEFLYSLDFDGSNFYIAEALTPGVDKYNSAMSYDSNFANNISNYGQGIDYNGTTIALTSSGGHYVLLYSEAGVYQGTWDTQFNVALAGITSGPNKEFYYILENNVNWGIYKYFINGTIVGLVERVDDDGVASPYGIKYFDGRFYIMSQGDNTVYIFEGPPASTPAFTINITEPFPYVYNNTVTDLKYNVIQGTGDKCWSSTDFGVTNSSTVDAGTNFTLSSTPAVNNWTVYCNSTSGVSANDNVTFTVNKSVSATLHTPADATIGNFTFNSFNFTVRGVNSALANATLRIWYSNGTIFYSNLTNVPGTNPNEYNIVRNVTSFGESAYVWNAEACGAGVSCATSENRTLEVGLTTPNLTIHNPSGNLGAVSNGTILLFNWSISEGSKVLSNHISNCNYTYNSVTTPINLTYCVNVTSFGLPYISGQDNLTMRVQDIAGNINETTTSWIVTLSEINQSFNTPVIEGSLQEYEVWIISSGAFQVLVATLDYNGTKTVGTLENPTGNTYKASTSFVVPVVTADTTVDFKWTFTLNDSSTVNSTTKNQTITNITIDDCSSEQSILFNFTIANELTETILHKNGTDAKINLQILDSAYNTELVSFNSSFVQVNPFGICLNTNLTGSSLKLDMQLEYSATNHSREFYHFQNETLNNDKFPTNITLLDLNLTSAQIFKISYKDASFLAVKDALIKIQRKYIDQNLFKSTEIPKTDNAGETLASLEVDDVIYNFIVSKNNIVLDTFTNFRVSCQNPTIQECTISLNSFRGAIPVTDFEKELDLSYTLTHDRDTRVVTFTYTVPSGTSSKFDLNVTKNDALGTSACTDTLTSSAGVLTCTIPASIGNTTVSAKVFRNNAVVAENHFSLQQLPSELYGSVVVVLALFIMLTLIGAGMSDNPIFTVIFFLVGVMLLYALNLVANNGFIGGAATILWLIVAIILVIIKGGKKD